MTHYLDDLLFDAPGGSVICHNILSTFEGARVPLDSEKTVTATTELVFRALH